MNREKHIELYKKMITTDPETINEMANSGMFNSIIEGYLVLTLQAMGKTDDEIIKAQHTLHRQLDDRTAAEAREAAE